MLATVSRKLKQTCNTKDQRRDSKRRCRRNLCVIWQILQCYNFLIEGSSGIYLCTQMESFLRHYDHYAEKNFWFGQFCNATIFSSKAALVFICGTQMEWFSRDELPMWRILQCYNFLIEGQVWGSSVHVQIHWFSRDDDNAEKNFWCAKFCNATVFSSKVALVIQLHSQMESFFSNAGTSKVANLHCYKFPPQRWLWWSSVSTHMEWFSGYVWWCREELPDFVKKCAPLSHAFLLSTAVI